MLFMTLVYVFISQLTWCWLEQSNQMDPIWHNTVVGSQTARCRMVRQHSNRLNLLMDNKMWWWDQRQTIRTKRYTKQQLSYSWRAEHIFAEGSPRKLADRFNYGWGLLNPDRAAKPGYFYGLALKTLFSICALVLTTSHSHYCCRWAFKWPVTAEMLVFSKVRVLTSTYVTYTLQVILLYIITSRFLTMMRYEYPKKQTI